MKLIKNIAINFLLALSITLAAQPYVAPSASPVNIAVAIVAGSAALQALSILLFGHKFQLNVPGRHVFMAIQKELWTDYIIDNLFKGNEFLKRCFRADQWVIAGKIVHMPVAGSKPTVVKNRSSLPASVTQRTDTDITYLLDEFTTDPVLIKNADKMELSYDKQDSVLSEHQQGLNELVGDDILIKWCKATGGSTTTAYIIRTTGAAVAAHLASATGNRKKFVKENLKAARKYMNSKNIPKTDRIALFSTELLDQLTDDTTLNQRDNAQELNLKEGVVMRLYGFDIMERSSTVIFDNTPEVKALGAAAAATDNDAVICFQAASVEAAIGEVNFFENQDDPTYYGDVYSGLVRAGGRIRRADGVVAIVQDASA